MDSRTELMILMGAAIGANCIPCFDHLYAKAREARLGQEEVEKVVELAFKVKNGAGVFLKKAIGELAEVKSDTTGNCCEHTCNC